MSSKVRYQQETKCNVNLPHSSLLTSQGLQVEGQCGDCEPQAGEEQQQEQTEILSSITDSATMRNVGRDTQTPTTAIRHLLPRQAEKQPRKLTRNVRDRNAKSKVTGIRKTSPL